MKSWIILFTIDILLYYFISFRVGAIAFVFVFLKILWDIGLFTPIKFCNGQFKHSEIYYISYTGEYMNVGKEFAKINEIFNKFNLDKYVYSSIGIYYDDPKKMTDKSKCRAVLGICKDSSDFSRNKSVNQPLEEYLRENNFRKAEIPDTNSLRVTFPYVNMISMLIGIKKFYKALNSNLSDENFKRSFRIDSKKISCTVEIYAENEMVFYVPLQNNEKFNLHTKSE
jgi:hypothetical protein